MGLTTRYSLLAFNLNALLDQGVKMPIDEVRELIDDGSLLDRLEQRFAGEPPLLRHLATRCRRGATRRVAGVRRARGQCRRETQVRRHAKGLALLLAYCIEVMKSADAYADYDDAGE
jgi:hypothetical protein